MFSESFMRYLIEYQSEEFEQEELNNFQSEVEKRPLMIDLTGVKYVTVPIRNRTK